MASPDQVAADDSSDVKNPNGEVVVTSDDVETEIKRLEAEKQAAVEREEYR